MLPSLLEKGRDTHPGGQALPIEDILQDVLWLLFTCRSVVAPKTFTGCKSQYGL